MPTTHYGQPRYQAIAEELRRRIEVGDIPPGALIPAESSLMAEFRVSRGTVRRAIDAIRQLGLVTTEQGRGTYASPHHGGKDPEPTETYADAELARLFQVEVGAKLLRREWITIVDDSVKSVTRSYFRSPS